MNRNSFDTIFLATIFFASAMAHALPSDQDQPLVIDCDETKLILKENNSIECTGDASVTQGTLKIQGDNFRLENEGTADELYVLTGSPAKAQQQPQANSDIVYLEGNTIKFLSNQKQINATQNAKFKRGEGLQITSDDINYNMVTGQYNSTSSRQGQGRSQLIRCPASNPDCLSDL